MRVLFLTHAFNSLAQRLFVELREKGHKVSVEFDINDVVTTQAVDRYRPDVILAPFLKRAIPESIWRHHVCLVVHPGIKGDRGPSALDWAILNDEQAWGVTVLQANEEMDAGDIWAAVEFTMRRATKASVYRNQVAEAAVEAVLKALERLQQKGFSPQPLDPASPDIRGRLRPFVRQQDRRIDWARDNSNTVLRKIASADGFPGVRDRLFGREVFLYDAHYAPEHTGVPGEVIAYSGSAICRATQDGAVWLGHLREPGGEHPFKLPATRVLSGELSGLREIPPGTRNGYREIWYQERQGVGYLHFPFYNGAMGSEQCEALRQALSAAKGRGVRVLVLMGGADFWSNGMHLNLIEAAPSPADESWRNINAIDDLALDIINSEELLIISALQGNCGAGGVFLARAADQVWARRGVVLNPHYKDMGNLYGSEYWTYLLPRFAGETGARRISQARLPMGMREAGELGLVDRVLPGLGAGFIEAVEAEAAALAKSSSIERLLAEKSARRQADEALRPLASYREQELERMRLNFYGFDPSYHVARYNFVYKVPKSRTPVTIALHRRID